MTVNSIADHTPEVVHPSWCAADHACPATGFFHLLDLGRGVRIEQWEVPSADFVAEPVVTIDAETIGMSARDAFDRAARLAHAATVLGIEESLPSVVWGARAARAA
jgi:hypothetical protein